MAIRSHYECDRCKAKGAVLRVTRLAEKLEDPRSQALVTSLLMLIAKLPREQGNWLDLCAGCVRALLDQALDDAPAAVK